ncbi:MAG: hypothetical protein SPI94_04720 [Candidatus Onthovivens sp.]|nr:hypothetical protein [Candidatus Onthovivens sp.]
MEEKEKQFTQEFMQERNFNYMIISNRIKNYYKKMFNIEIINLFYKRKKKKSANQMVQQENYLRLIQAETFDFYILIKDNNKKIFKYKLLKAKYDNAKYRENKSENLDFMEKLYIFVDESLGNYCKKKYINKLNSEDLNNLIRKDGEINEDYKNWIIENYFETEENQENSEQN